MFKKFSSYVDSPYYQSKNDFSRAYRRGFWRSIFSLIRNTDNRLLPFHEVLQHIPLRGEHSLGVKQIETSKIVGSVNRFHDFDRAFLPKQTNTRARWESVNTAYFKDIILPPIDVYKVSEVYFVRDGHHRVSVARERGQAYMDAYVIEIDVRGILDENTSIQDLVMAHEYAVFLTRSKLDLVIPGADCRFSIPGQYDRLLQHISVHRWYMGEKLDRPITDEEAALGWYKEVYMPLVRIIRKHKILNEFPQRTETDLYLWIIEHRWYLAEESKEKVSLEKAATHFMNRFSNRPFRHLRQFLKWVKKKIFKKKKA
ncbi:MAG: transcriptional regulator [Chloroflexi bacterium HGW-Chloroflexi-7]|nr:MAG: transcriptional regulator [Chloroflexi bacterium HGW-Chloroflexi-7]